MRLLKYQPNLNKLPRTLILHSHFVNTERPRIRRIAATSPNSVYLYHQASALYYHFSNSIAFECYSWRPANKSVRKTSGLLGKYEARKAWRRCLRKGYDAELGEGSDRQIYGGPFIHLDLRQCTFALEIQLFEYLESGECTHAQGENCSALTIVPT